MMSLPLQSDSHQIAPCLASLLCRLRQTSIFAAGEVTAEISIVNKALTLVSCIIRFDTARSKEPA